jgi:nucleoside-diphosphate-sugar epimerase
MQGVRLLFHVASPFALQVDDGQRDLIDPAVKGTANVVSTALRTPSVERIVLTSSTATIVSMAKAEGYRYTEADWNDDWPVARAPYQLSKVLAERKAWELVDAHNAVANQPHPVRLVTILPSVVIGPPIGHRVDGVSVNLLTDLLDGSLVESGVRPVNVGDVDVRDVAFAHVAAAEVPNACGRYIVSSTDVSNRLEYARIVQPMFPDTTMPSKAAGPWLFKTHTMDHNKSEKELGVTYTGRETSIREMAAKLIDIGLIKKD